MRALKYMCAALVGLALFVWGVVAFPPSHRFLVHWECYRDVNKMMHYNETADPGERGPFQKSIRAGGHG